MTEPKPSDRGVVFAQVLLALFGIAAIATSVAADRLGIGGQPGFGQKQLVLAIAGVLVLLVAMALRSGMISRTLFSRDNYFYSQILFLLVLNIFAGLALSGGFLAKTSLYWDNLHLYSFFRDNLHSLNHFGEIQWWHPNIQTGFPIYYTSILGVNSTTPLFVTLGVGSWILGLFNIQVSSYHALYVLYFGFSVPLLFSVGLLLLARQIFRNHAVIFFILLIGSFSPGVVFNLSDNGLEQTAYGLFFAAAYLNFLKRPSRKTFWALVVMLLVLAISFNHLFLYWNIVFIPLFVVICNLCSYDGFLASTKRIAQSVPVRVWLVALVLVVASALPAVITFSQGQDILRSRMGTRTYSFGALKPGNPLEVLSVGTLGIGFEWSAAWPGGDWTVFAAQGRHVGYTYLGMLVLSLSGIGLTVGKRIWRMRLFGMIGVTSVIVILSGYSPLFGSILAWSSPLRAVNHYSDSVFRNGIFLFLILSAGLGLETILRQNKRLQWVLIPCFLFFSLISMLLFVAVYRESTLRSPLFGFALVMIMLYLVVLAWMALAKTDRHKREAFVFLLFLTLIDTSTVAFWHVRTVIWPNSQSYAEPAIDSIGLGTNDPRSFHATNLLYLRQVRELQDTGVDPFSLPVLALFTSARTTFEGTSATTERILSSLVLPEKYTRMDEFRRFFEHGGDYGSSDGRVTIVRQTYNGLDLEVVAPEASLLFWRDAYFPYWNADVNGKRATIAEAFGAFKAVSVPAGKSEVKFWFSPSLIPFTLGLAYMIIPATVVLWWMSSRPGDFPLQKLLRRFV